MTTPAASASLTPRKLTRPEKARLFLNVIRAYVKARRAIARNDLRDALTRLRGSAPADADGPPDRNTLIETTRLASVVQRVLRPLPGDTRCLTQSLVLTSLLAERGIGSKLVIGVTPGEKFGAHAWVELGGRPLLPTGGDKFSRLVDL